MSGQPIICEICKASFETNEEANRHFVACYNKAHGIELEPLDASGHVFKIRRRKA